MIVVDATVLVYAVGASHPLRDPCRRLVESIGQGTLSATTTVEVIQEFTHVRARRRDREESSATARSFVTLLGPLMRPDEDDMLRGLDLFSRIEGLGAFDAVLAATVLGSDRLTGLISADRSFAAVSDLDHLDPAAPDLFADLGLSEP